MGQLTSSSNSHQLRQYIWSVDTPVFFRVFFPEPTNLFSHTNSAKFCSNSVLEYSSTFSFVPSKLLEFAAAAIFSRMDPWFDRFSKILPDFFIFIVFSESNDLS